MINFLIAFMLLGGGAFVSEVVSNIHKENMAKIALKERELSIKEQELKMSMKYLEGYDKARAKITKRLLNSTTNEDIWVESQYEKDAYNDIEEWENF